MEGRDYISGRPSLDNCYIFKLNLNEMCSIGEAVSSVPNILRNSFYIDSHPIYIIEYVHAYATNIQ